MGKTKIEWATEVWNPVTGCTPVSEGCQKCYARRIAKRLAGRFGYPKNNPFAVTLHPDRLDEPLKWRKPRRVFVCSMGDLFYKGVPAAFIFDIFSIIGSCRQHTFYVLTKRPERIDEVLYGPPNFYFGGGDYLPNVVLMTSVENQKWADIRIPELLKAADGIWKTGVSIEPMLGPVNIGNYLHRYYVGHAPDCRGWGGRECNCQGWKYQSPALDWVIVGGETGPGARPCDPDWIRLVRDQCVEAGVPFFLKQINARRDRELDGRVWEEYPK